LKRIPGWRDALAGLTACAIALSAVPASAKRPENIAMEGGLGAGSALASLVWSPLKLLHATGGLVIGGLGMLWTGGDGEIPKRIFKRALTGDYVVTPEHLQGKKRLRFTGGGDKKNSGGGGGDGN
jgi:hypothetical protein